jgi:hypothetical protein
MRMMGGAEADTGLFFDGFHQQVEQLVDAGIIELCGDGADDGQVFVFGRPQAVIAFVLFRISCSASSAPALSNLLSTTRSA